MAAPATEYIGVVPAEERDALIGELNAEMARLISGATPVHVTVEPQGAGKGTLLYSLTPRGGISRHIPAVLLMMCNLCLAPALQCFARFLWEAAVALAVEPMCRTSRKSRFDAECPLKPHVVQV